MSIQFRNYANEPGITQDYYKVREFFVDLGFAEYTYARWDWMITHSSLEQNAVGKIGIWEDSGRIIGAALFDTRLGETFCMTFPQYAHLKNEMLRYAMGNLAETDRFSVLISDNDVYFQDIAARHGFMATPESDEDAAFYIEKSSTDYMLPEGFRVTSMKDTYSPFHYRKVLWKGFNHELNGEGEFTFTEEIEKAVHDEMIRPNVDLSLKIAVVAPDGNFVSYCGMWYEPKAGFAVIEPVATDPDYRKMGLGKAAVLEGIKRVGQLGAKIALVGSSQQFYYSIGLRPYAKATKWKMK